MSWGVLFYEIYNKEDSEKEESKNAISVLVKYYIILGCIISLFLSTFSFEIVKVVATPEYLPGIIVIPILLFSAIIAQLIEIIGVGITLSEKTIYFTYILVISGLVNFGLNFLFVPLLSYYGAAFTTIIAYLVNLILTYKISQRYFVARYDVLNLTFLFALFLIISTIIPFFEIKKIFLFPIYLKLGIFFLCLSLPFLFGFINLNQFKNLLKRNS